MVPRALPDEVSEIIGLAMFLECEKGRGRSRLLGEWAEALPDGTRSWKLSVSLSKSGPWAGISNLLWELVDQSPPEATPLLVKHDYELLSVLPALRKRFTPRNPCLTDVASPHEQVRLYPADRAQRIIHGLIDFLVEWKEHYSPAPWVILCDDFDESGHLVRSFFSNLLRRRGRSAGIGIVAVCSPGTTAEAASVFPAQLIAGVVEGRIPPEPEEPIPAEEAARRALDLEARVGDDPAERELYLPSLVHYWSLSGARDRALPWEFEAFSIYTSRGFYLDSIAYGDGALAYLDRHFVEDESKRWKIVNKLFACHCATGNPQQALDIVQATLLHLRSPLFVAMAHYVLAMLHARYLPKRNLDLAEQHLEAGVEYLEMANLGRDEFLFQFVFNRNGLALIRNFQGLALEAIRLCQEGYALLTDNLAEDRHRLHRSVLLYNIAQVYSSLGELDEAARHYAAASEMDPNYSEYYNERGNLLFKKGLVQNAIEEYQRSLELSPPFPEVRTNLGHCYRRLGRIDNALQAYSDSLDLNHQQPDVYVMRAQCYEEAGRIEEALTDYGLSLALNGGQPLVLANRACLLYSQGQLHAALSDLETAIRLAPDLADLYQNRATALLGLDRIPDAVRDLEYYLRLKPEAEDREEVALQIEDLKAKHASDSVS